MRIINSSKDITTLEVGDNVVFGNLTYTVKFGPFGYYLSTKDSCNDRIFDILNVNKYKFIKALGIHIDSVGTFPETKSLEALTAIVSALFKEYEKQNELPKTWEEFCERSSIQDGECYIDRRSNIEVLYKDDWRDDKLDRNVCTSKQEAEAFLALMQLRQLRKAYVKDWEPDWISDIKPKYCVDLQGNDFSIQCWYHMNSPLSFPTYDLAEQFLNNFKDLLEIAKPLL